MTDTYIDNDPPVTYTEGDTGWPQQPPPNLENQIVRCFPKGDTMPSLYRKSYKYEDSTGIIQSVRFNGFSRADTDLQYQLFLNRQPPAPTLIDFVEKTFRESFISNLGQTSQVSYNRYLEDYIYPFLGRIPINEITVADIQNMYDWLAHGSKNGFKKDIAKRSIERIGGFLGRILKVAEAMHVIDESPYKPVLLRNHGVPSRHHKAVTDEEVARIRAAVPLLTDRRERLYAALLVYTGMRREEILGLRWENIHLDDGYGDVVQVVVYPDNKYTVVKDHPKTTSSERSFIIPDALADILCPEKRSSGFVIEGRTPDDPASFSTFQRTSRAVFKKLGMTRYDNHDWRATFATQLKESGMTSAQVADLLGHADTRMVETVYATARKQGILKYKNAVDSICAGTGGHTKSI